MLALRWLTSGSTDSLGESVARVRIDRDHLPPKLNPVEQIWNHGKRVDLCNLAPKDSHDLRGHVRRSLTGQRHRPDRLAAVLDHARLRL